jgi:hypothetical protein
VSLTLTGSTGNTMVNSPNQFLITYNLPISDVGSVTVTCSGGTNSPWVSGVCSGLGTPYLSGLYTVIIPFAAAGPTFVGDDGSELQVYVRVVASKASSLPFIVTASVASSGNQISLHNNPTVENVLLINKTALTLSDLTASQVLTCIGAKSIASYGQTFELNLAESFTNALTSESQEMINDPDTGVTGEAPPMSWASDVANGSNFTITFSGVPAGVGIKFVSDTPCSQLDPTDPNYCAGGTLAVALLSPAAVTSATAGQISFTFGVTSDDNGVGPAENVDFNFTYWSDGPILPGNSPNTITANVSYAPNTTGYPTFVSTPEDATPPAVVHFYDCVTNLLFPFVTNTMAGGDTAWNNLGTSLFVANTTADPFTTANVANLASPLEVAGGAVPQSGACTFWLFPNLDNSWDGKAGTAAMWTSPTVQPGATIGFDLGSVPAFAGKTGYVFAQCGFQNAHGVEYISDNYAIGEPGYAQAFQAIVIPTVELYHRSPAGDGLGETAIAPIAVDKLVQELLSGGIHNGASVGGLF